MAKSQCDAFWDYVQAYCPCILGSERHFAIARSSHGVKFLSTLSTHNEKAVRERELQEKTVLRRTVC